jgi:CheY-like chemotaxis protein/anti-sigma regulatory factor (Ser/Thr protein kinase)
MKEEVQLPSFLNQLVDMMRLQVRDAGLTFNYSTPTNLPDSVYTDEKRLRQILINLLSNAIRYTDAGSVTLRTSYSGQVARFDIEDTGLGIAPDDLKRIFEPFERIEHPGRAAVSGSGLGLTITRLLTEALGGELTVTSTPGKGSLFSVRLMLAPVPATQRVTSARDRVIEGYQGPRRRILVVDDDSRQTDLLSESLGRLGFVVEVENSGAAGLARALSGNPDAILLDISMPGLSGWEVARQLRIATPRRVPIIMISAFAPEPTGARDPDHDDYLMKPLRTERLLESLHKLLALDWISRAAEQKPRRPGVTKGEKLVPEHLDALSQLGQIGHLRGILLKLDEIGAQQPGAAPTLAALRRLTEDCDLAGFRTALEGLMRHDA